MLNKQSNKEIDFLFLVFFFFPRYGVCKRNVQQIQVRQKNQELNNVEGRDGKKAALCKQVLTFNTVFYLTFLGLCCQVALNLQSCRALEFSGTACLETTTEQNLVLCCWKDVCFLLVSAGDRSFCGPGANRVIAA